MVVFETEERRGRSSGSSSNPAFHAGSRESHHYDDIMGERKNSEIHRGDTNNNISTNGSSTGESPSADTSGQYLGPSGEGYDYAISEFTL